MPFLRALVPLIIIIFGFCLAGCSGSLPEYFGDAYPLLYGLEGSDTSLLVINMDGLYGYAKMDGTIAIKPQFLYARPFFEGLAAVRNKNGKYGYIDVQGKTIIPYRYYGATDFHNGKALISNRLINIGELNMELISVIDKKGIMLKEMNYTHASNYKEGITIASAYNNQRIVLDENYNPLEIMLDGKEAVIPIDYSEGLAIFSRKGASSIEFIGWNGAQPFEGKFADAMVFTDGLAPVKYFGSDFWGYIDKSGRMVIDSTFQTAGNFANGLAIVQKDGQWLLIDPCGRETASIQIIIDTSMTFQEGLCPVGRMKENDVSFERMSLDYDWGFIDTTGKLVIDFQYDLVTPFTNGIAQVLVDGKIGYIDKTGKYIWEPK